MSEAELIDEVISLKAALLAKDARIQQLEAQVERIEYCDNCGKTADDRVGKNNLCGNCTVGLVEMLEVENANLKQSVETANAILLAKAHTIDELRDMLDVRQVQIERLEQANRWIPVSEMRPWNGVKVMVAKKAEGGGGYIVHTDWMAGGVWQASLFDNVTHWRPMPAPPEVAE